MVFKSTTTLATTQEPTLKSYIQTTGIAMPPGALAALIGRLRLFTLPRTRGFSVPRPGDISTKGRRICHWLPLRRNGNMTNIPAPPSPLWRAVTNNFSRLSKDLGGNFFRAYARRQCLVGIDGMLGMTDAELAGYGTNRDALVKLRARLAAGNFPPPADSETSAAA